MRLVMLSKIKRYFKNKWFKLVKKPYLDFLEKRRKEKFTKDLIRNFHKTFGVHPDYINQLIRANEKIPFGIKANVVMTNEEYVEFLKKQLVESAILRNNRDRSPFFMIQKL